MDSGNLINDYKHDTSEQGNVSGPLALRVVLVASSGRLHCVYAHNDSMFLQSGYGNLITTSYATLAAGFHQESQNFLKMAAIQALSYEHEVQERRQVNSVIPTHTQLCRRAVEYTSYPNPTPTRSRVHQLSQPDADAQSSTPVIPTRHRRSSRVHQLSQPDADAQSSTPAIPTRRRRAVEYTSYPNPTPTQQSSTPVIPTRRVSEGHSVAPAVTTAAIQFRHYSWRSASIGSSFAARMAG